MFSCYCSYQCCLSSQTRHRRNHLLVYYQWSAFYRRDRCCRTPQDRQSSLDHLLAIL